MGAATAVAVIGLVASAGQAIYQNEQQKKAESRAKAARNRAAGISESNPFEGLQAPDVSRLAFEETSQSEADALRAAQDLGEAGAAQVTNIVKAGRDQKLKAAEKQAKLEYERDAAEASAEQGIEARKAQRQASMELASVQANMQAAQQAQANMVGAVTGAFDSAGALVKGIESDKLAKNKSQGLDTNIGGGSVNVLTPEDEEMIEQDLELGIG
tara:strand:+ start:10537 stop:11178 length:642 start_codon:yes stop_codon:yes gene_type:complete